mgnify:FL=1
MLAPLRLSSRPMPAPSSDLIAAMARVAADTLARVPILGVLLGVVADVAEQVLVERARIRRRTDEEHDA